MPKALIFDFYGVICSEIGSQWYQMRPPQELIPELKEKYDTPPDTGEISEEAFFAGIAASVGLTGEEVRQEWLRAAVIDQELLEYIQYLKKQFKLAICSNTAPKIFRDILKLNDIENLFDVVVASSEVGMVKPNADIFLYTLNELGVEPDEAIFIDDRESNIKGAEAMGIPSILYTNPTQFRVNLDKILFQ